MSKRNAVAALLVFGLAMAASGVVRARTVVRHGLQVEL